jgi:hypothetical protein
VRDHELVTLGEGDLLIVLVVDAPVTSSWTIAKRNGLLLRGACEVVVEIAIYIVEENLAIRDRPMFFVELAWIIR